MVVDSGFFAQCKDSRSRLKNSNTHLDPWNSLLLSV